jgi:hypothetical protein
VSTWSLSDPEPVAAVASELERGERLLWQGVPDRRRWLYPRDALLIPFSVMMGGFAILWEIAAISAWVGGNGPTFALWGIPFVLAGVHMMFGRFLMRHWMRSRTVYAVTDRRVLSIVAALRGERTTTSVWLGSFPPVDKRIGRDGRGTLWIGTLPIGDRSVAGDPGWPGFHRVAGNATVFADIPNADDVYSLIGRRIGELSTARTAA